MESALITAGKYFAIGLALTLTTASAWGSGGDRVPGSRYVSGRGAAMGDAFIGLADDGASALFYNPAAIAKLREVEVSPLNLQLQANSSLMSETGLNTYKVFSLPSFASTLTSNPGISPGGSFALAPTFSMRGFAFGLLYQNRVWAQSDGTHITYKSSYQLIPTAGFGLRLASGVLRIGYALQWVNQASGTKTVAKTASPLGYSEGIGEGSGFSHNVGMALTLPYVYQPSINIVARNIGGLSYSGKSILSMASNPSGKPAKEDMSVDASLGFLTKLGNGFGLNTQFELRDATNASNTSILGRAAAGLEFEARESFFLRGGVGSGYPNAGLGIKTDHNELNFTWMSEEIGDGFRKSRDIRYLFQYILRAF